MSMTGPYGWYGPGSHSRGGVDGNFGWFGPGSQGQFRGPMQQQQLGGGNGGNNNYAPPPPTSFDYGTGSLKDMWQRGLLASHQVLPGLLNQRPTPGLNGASPFYGSLPWGTAPGDARAVMNDQLQRALQQAPTPTTDAKAKSGGPDDGNGDGKIDKSRRIPWAKGDDGVMHGFPRPGAPSRTVDGQKQWYDYKIGKWIYWNNDKDAWWAVN